MEYLFPLAGYYNEERSVEGIFPLVLTVKERGKRIVEEQSENKKKKSMKSVKFDLFI